MHGTHDPNEPSKEELQIFYSVLLRMGGQTRCTYSDFPRIEHQEYVQKEGKLFAFARL